jgi:hypothetical protein
MGLHLYCIAPAAHLPTGVVGIGGAPVRGIPCGDLTLWVSAHDAPAAASMDAIKAHNTVVTAGMTAEVTPVPLRFGQYFSDEADAIASISTSHEKWQALLLRIAGAVEYGVRVFEPERETAEEAGGSPARDPSIEERDSAAVPGGGPGSRYLAALAQRKRGPEAAARAVLESMAKEMDGLLLEQRSQPLRTEHGVLSVAHLLHPREAAQYQAALERVRAQLPHLRLLSSGPWPPYSFVQNDD